MRSDHHIDRGNSRSRKSSRIGAAFALASLLAFAAVAPTFAGDCNTDIGKLMKARQSIIDKLNKLVATAPKHQLDPTTSCGSLRELAAAERELTAYLTKNKDWCQVPDSAVANIEASAKKTATIAGNACRVAEQIKKNQDALGTGPALPHGPL
jgi:hypothetical protein